MGRKRELKKDSDLPKYVYPKNGAYRLQYVKENGKRGWKYLGKTKHQALAEYYRLTGETIKVVTMADLIDRYMKEIAPTKAEKSYKENIKQHVWLKRFFGTMLPDAIKPVHIYQYLDERGVKAAKPAPRSANLEKALLSHIFTIAIRWGIVEDNPCRNVRSLKVPSKEKLYVEDKDFWAVHSIASPNIKLIMELAWITGLRRKDLLKIKKSDIKETGIELFISKKKKRALMLWTDELRAWYEKAKQLRTPILSMYLLPNEEGLKYTEDGFSTVFYKVVVKAREMGLIQNHFSIHDLRAKALTDADEIHGREFAQQQGAHESQKVTVQYLRKPIKIKSWK